MPKRAQKKRQKGEEVPPAKVMVIVAHPHDVEFAGWGKRPDWKWRRPSNAFCFLDPPTGRQEAISLQLPLAKDSFLD